MPDVSPPAVPLREIDLEEVVFWAENYNEGDVGAVYYSLVTFGYNRSISVWLRPDRRYMVIAGNTTGKALLQWKHDYETASGTAREQLAPKGNLRISNGRWIIQVSDSSHLTEAEAVAYAIADNRTAERSSHDEDLLLKHLFSIQNDAPDALPATGYDDREMRDLYERVRETVTDEEEDATAGAGSAESDVAGNSDQICPCCGKALSEGESVQEDDVWL